MINSRPVVTLSPQDYDAVLFDGFLEQRAADTGEPFGPFDIGADYRRYVDGKPRYDGVAAFLASRGIVLPSGAPEDAPGTQTVHAPGNLKDQYFVQQLEQHGVEVRLLYEPIGSQAHAGRAYVRDMQSVGIRMAPTSPLYLPHAIGYRNHRKIAVVDGAISYTGGMNIGREQLSGGKGFDSWRDTQVRIVGEGAALLQAVFMGDWYNAVQENLFSAASFPADAMEPVNPDGDVPVQILTSSPDSQRAAIRQLYALMIVSAQQHVFIQSPSFVPDATIAEALMTAALSGVDVKLMLSARPSGNQLPDWAGHTYIAGIVTAGVRVFLYEKGYLQVVLSR